MFITIFLLLFETLTWQEIAVAISSIVFALWLWKSGIPQQLFTSTNSLLTIRTNERDDARRERDKFKNECENLEEEMKVLRREIIQRIDINLQDQDTIRELRNRIRELE